MPKPETAALFSRPHAEKPTLARCTVHSDGIQVHRESLIAELSVDSSFLTVSIVHFGQLLPQPTLTTERHFASDHIALLAETMYTVLQICSIRVRGHVENVMVYTRGSRSN